MGKAIIYTITVTKACASDEQGTYHSLNPWCVNSQQYEGYDDGGKVFALPEGVAIGRDPNGSRILYEKASGRSVEIGSKNGTPVLRYGSYRYGMEEGRSG